jgi:hypothetical protein
MAKTMATRTRTVRSVSSRSFGVSGREQQRKLRVKFRTVVQTVVVKLRPVQNLS